MNEKVYFHVYVSSAAQPYSRDELLRLLRQCQANNSKLGITGMLLYKDGNFMQALEGPKEQTEKLIEKIRQDPRHHQVLTLDEGESTDRQFPNWSMAFHNLNSEELKSTPGYSEFMNLPLSSAEFKNPTTCQRLLTIFKSTVR